MAKWRFLASTLQTSSEVYILRAKTNGNLEEYRKSVSQTITVSSCTKKEAALEVYDTDIYRQFKLSNPDVPIYLFWFDLLSHLHRYFHSAHEINDFYNLQNIARLYKRYQFALSKGVTLDDLFYDFILQENFFDHDVTDLDSVTNYLLNNCNPDTRLAHDELYEKGAETPEDQYQLALLLLKAANEVQRKMHPNSPACQIILESYRTPALYWAMEAVEQDYLPAFSLESMLVSTTSKDIAAYPALSLSLLVHAALSGDTKAQLSLAFNHTQTSTPFNSTKTVEYDLDLAKFWYTILESKDDPEAYHDLAIRYYERIEKDYVKANEYFLKLIGMGKLEYYYNLIRNYYRIGNLKLATEQINQLLDIDDSDLIISIYKKLKMDVFLNPDTLDVEIRFCMRIIELSKSLEQQAHLAELLIRKGNIDACKTCIYSILGSNNEKAISYAYNLFAKELFDRLQDVALEIEFLKCALHAGNNKASCVLEKCYKRTLLGKWKRTRQWKANAIL